LVSNDFWWTKAYFGVLDNLYLRQKVVLLFSEGQEFQFLFSPLSQICHGL